MGVRCFLLEPVDRVRRWLRCYTDGPAAGGPWTCAGGWHEAKRDLDVVAAEYGKHGRYKSLDASLSQGEPPHEDPRWPTQCAKGCGYAFVATDRHHILVEQEWKRADSGELCTLEDAPPGAMWNAWWLTDIPEYCGPDGQALHCRLPDGHDWHIDGPASNCTLKDERPRVHRCWVRHGVPPDLTVDKGGRTCNAGAGSIQSPRAGGWHGFLRAGVLA